MKPEEMKSDDGKAYLYDEEPLLISAEDLQDVVGGCVFGCSDGSCS